MGKRFGCRCVFKLIFSLLIIFFVVSGCMKNRCNNIITIQIDVSYLDGRHAFPNQFVTLCNSPKVIDTLYIDHKNRAIYEANEYQYLILHHNTAIEPSLVETSIFKSIAESPHYSYAETTIDGVDVIVFTHYDSSECMVMKSWLWFRGDLEYMISLKKKNATLDEMKSIFENIELKSIVANSDNYYCGYLIGESFPLSLQYFENRI